MAGVNKVIIMGNLGSDPKLSTTQGGMAEQDSLVCIYCGQVFYRNKNIGRKAFSKRKFCSKSCACKYSEFSAKYTKFKPGNEHLLFKTGKYKNHQGYVCVLNTQKDKKRRYILEHVQVMENYLGRPLEKNEVVHHVNGKKDDNSIDNLELMLHSEHLRFHSLGKKISEKTRALLVSQRKGTHQKECHNQWKADITKERIIELYEKHSKQKDVAEKLGIRADLLRFRMKHYGIYKKGGGINVR